MDATDLMYGKKA